MGSAKLQPVKSPIRLVLVAAGPWVAKPLAFETEECHLVERVRRTQHGIELQAIDDTWRVAETDVLRSQVDVCVDARSGARRPPRADVAARSAGSHLVQFYRRALRFSSRPADILWLGREACSSMRGSASRHAGRPDPPRQSCTTVSDLAPIAFGRRCTGPGSSSGNSSSRRKTTRQSTTSPVPPMVSPAGDIVSATAPR
jgi:hypothetical protein